MGQSQHGSLPTSAKRARAGTQAWIVSGLWVMALDAACINELERAVPENRNYLRSRAVVFQRHVFDLRLQNNRDDDAIDGSRFAENDAASKAENIHKPAAARVG